MNLNVFVFTVILKNARCFHGKSKLIRLMAANNVSVVIRIPNETLISTVSLYPDIVYKALEIFSKSLPKLPCDVYSKSYLSLMYALHFNIKYTHMHLPPSTGRRILLCENMWHHIREPKWFQCLRQLNIREAS